MKRILICLSAMCLTAIVFAQTPQKMTYQAVVRNGSDVLVANTTIGMQISILQGSATGTVVYIETLTASTNANGLVSVEIGGGAGFSAIDWANGPFFLKTETDPVGGTNYTITGTSQLLTVPYALHAKTAEVISGGIVETDPDFNASVASGIVVGDISNWNNKLAVELDGSSTNEIQVLSIRNDTIFLTEGGFIKLPAGFDGQYSSLIGVPTNVSSFTNDAGYLTSFTEVDGSDTNELQILSISNDTIRLTNGGFVKLPVVDGSETKVTAGTNIIVTGIGTTANPYILRTTDTLEIGDLYQGGIIFWLDATGKHGLIAAIADQSAGIQWFNGVSKNAGSTGDGLFAGAMNTAMIVAIQMGDNPTGNFAAKVCADYFSIDGGVTYGDWYLPSKYELNLLCLQKMVVGGFGGGTYWSSSEFGLGNAYGQMFVNCSQIVGGKAAFGGVRAIRSF